METSTSNPKVSMGSKLLIALNAVIFAAFLWSGWLTDWSFKLSDREAVSNERARKANADCILANMRGVTDRVAAVAIRKACSEKFPVVDRYRS